MLVLSQRWVPQEVLAKVKKHRIYIHYWYDLYVTWLSCLETPTLFNLILFPTRCMNLESINAFVSTIALLYPFLRNVPFWSLWKDQKTWIFSHPDTSMYVCVSGGKKWYVFWCFKVAQKGILERKGLMVGQIFFLLLCNIWKMFWALSIIQKPNTLFGKHFNRLVSIWWESGLHSIFQAFR